MTDMLQPVGILIATAGTAIACLGVHVNNQRGNHTNAMQLWAISNPLLALWAGGSLAGLWDGGIPLLVLCLMYCYYTVSNWDGLRRKKGENV